MQSDEPQDTDVSRPLTLLDMDGAAAFLGISKRTLSGMISRQEAPPHIKISRSYRWLPSSIVTWIELQATGKARPATRGRGRPRKKSNRQSGGAK